MGRKPTLLRPIAGLLVMLALAQAASAQVTAPGEEPDVIERLEQLAREGRLPSYEDLRLPHVAGRDVVRTYLDAMPVMEDDYATTDVVFAFVDETSPYALLELPDLIELALDNNFELINSDRSVRIARSQARAEEAFFIPFVDLVASGRASRTRAHDSPSVTNPGEETKQTTTSTRVAGGIEATQNLPTGGSILLDVTESKTNTRTASGDGVMESRVWEADAELRFIQPLLRGSGLLTGDGTDIGTANLRRARLAELDDILADTLAERDVVLSVIRQYFRILQIKQQLLVSRDAIRERYRFLDETRVKYDVGRVAESEILRAEIQFLQEVETAIGRQQQLDDARDTLLILLGLPLETEVSLIDITGELTRRGRIEVPPLDQAVQMALSRRRELMRADINVQLAAISTRVARNNVLPDLDFDAGLAAFDADESFTRANEFDRDRADAGLALRIPLQNIQRREAHRQSVLRLEQARTNRLSLERDLTRQVYSTFRSVLTTEARLTVLQQRVAQARRNLELINESFEVGASTITEVRLAQDDLFNTEAAYSSAILNYQIGIAELYVAMGLSLM